MTENRFTRLLCQGSPVLLDGAMGTQLLARGLNPGRCPEALNLTRGGDIAAIHIDYLNAGAQIIYANTFGASEQKLSEQGLDFKRVAAAGVEIARRAAAPYGALAALDVGPTGRMIDLSDGAAFEFAYDQFARLMRVGEEAGADLIVIETMTSLAEMRAAVLAAKENTRLSVLATMSFERDGRTFTGCPVEAMALTLEGLGVDALGLNCSLGPDLMADTARRLLAATSLSVAFKPNAGMPGADGRYAMGPEEFARHMRELSGMGAALLGGCCGTSPAYIAALRDAVSGAGARQNTRARPAWLCSAQRVYALGGLGVVGERINPTGKKRFKQALIQGDMDYPLLQAVAQEDAGADLLDVNVGVPQIDEPAVMENLVRRLQGVCALPLVLDSSDPEALARALRAYHGVALINSVNGDARSLQNVLPLARKYGACVIGLTLDEQGIPETARGRLEIARRILDACERSGIPRERLVIDCLTMAVSAQGGQAVKTLESMRLVRRELNLFTVLGVSNVSFGLPRRDLVNRTFLCMAAREGLNLAIINPNASDMMEAVYAARLLRGEDEQARDFIAKLGGQGAKPAPEAAGEMGLGEAIERGLSGAAGRAARDELNARGEMELIERVIIPALDRVGERFEKGQSFLPQLIGAAEAAQAAFEVIKSRLAASDAPRRAAGRIVLATVQGDIHDIGKNIVKVILENYGFEVIDLGRDVPPERVVAAVLERKATLVGLSALMTTTLEAMRRTIRALNESGAACRVFVGGAVLTEETARELGADEYARDARAAAEIARRHFGAAGEA